MARFISKSLTVKFVVYFILIAVIPIGIVGYLSFYASRDSLLTSYSDKLLATGEDRKNGLIELLEEAMLDLKFLTQIHGVDNVFDFVAARSEKDMIVSREGNKAETELRKKIEVELETTLAAWQRIYGQHNGYRDVLLVSPDGHVVYTLKRESDFAEDLKNGALKDSGLGRVWNRVMKTGKPAFADFAQYQPSSAPTAFAAAPHMAANGKIDGLLIVKLGTEGVNRVFSQAQGLGKTAEAYVVGQDRFMRSNSRFEKSSTILKKKIETEGVKAALEGKSEVRIIEDYRGERVLSFFTPVGIKQNADLGADFDWVMLVEIDESEVMEPVRNLAMKIMGAAALIALAVAIVAFFAAKTITKPVIALSGQMAKASNGDLSIEIPGRDRDDELGVLAKSVHLMLSNLRSQVGKVLEAANVVSTASSEISATAAQVVASTSKTTSAVAESATTAAEVKQSAQVAGEKAKEVAQSAHEAVQTSTNGKKATDDTVSKMSLIRDQMESIGETVVRLSEHSQAIEDIIASVQDIADQSNLLAVNASIEAARAGDHGKGFAVVAHEIKTLADQSKHSTEQVRGILEDTRKWVSAVVMATEQGSKAVAAGVQQAEIAGGAIQTLATGVQGWAQTASMVDASSQQQAAGAEQVSLAMSNIDQAMQQVLAGVSQLETAARRLEDMSKLLSELLSGYKLTA
ncbi:MAG: methyl-accepting chemotaxis protein [Desulfomonile tiedjei]|uniref:Methyl-accepting chemotaxis protein n=1 Tax=Desulfomonile tiedjei TaxID=2358 RepID=A0A9D6V984_9BACT|nr:methyl-accepting chemotaxis protein [Desulfomonile tiedjei]